MVFIDLVRELAQWLRERGRNNVLEDYAFSSGAANAKDYTAVFEWPSGSPYGRTGVNMGVEQRNIQLRERRKTREEAYAACEEIRRIWDRGADEKTIRLSSATVLANTTRSTGVMDVEAQGNAVVCFCEFRFSCPTD